MAKTSLTTKSGKSEIQSAESARNDKLDWKRRHDIITGVAQGLLYLHEDAHSCIIHRDIIANILFNERWVLKIAEFCMARLCLEDKTQVNTRVAGTNGYMAPEYFLQGHLSIKEDVFIFGVVVPNEGLLCVQIELLCTQYDPQLRPSMRRIVVMLSTKLGSLEEPTRPGYQARQQKTHRRRKSSSTYATLSGINSRTIGSTSVQKGGESSPYIVELQKLEEQAKQQGLGRWSKVLFGKVECPAASDTTMITLFGSAKERCM